MSLLSQAICWTVLSMMLLLSVFVGVKGEITPTDYTMPDGTKITFGNVSTLIEGRFRHITNMQEDQYIPGNILVVDNVTINTLNGTNITNVAGNGIEGYLNDYGAKAMLNFPYACQVTPEILLLSESVHHCVRVLNRTDNNSVTDFVGNCTNEGYADGIGADAKFSYPFASAQYIHDPNLVFVAEQNSNIRLINVASRSVTTFIYARGFSYVTSISWAPYYCNVIILADSSTFRRLEIDTFTLTTYGNASIYVDGSLDVGQYSFLYEARAIYKDLYVATDAGANRLRVIDTASCVVSSVCSGTTNITDGNLDQCSTYLPVSRSILLVFCILVNLETSEPYPLILT